MYPDLQEVTKLYLRTGGLMNQITCLVGTAVSTAENSANPSAEDLTGSSLAPAGQLGLAANSRLMGLGMIHESHTHPGRPFLGGHRSSNSPTRLDSSGCPGLLWINKRTAAAKCLSILPTHERHLSPELVGQGSNFCQVRNNGNYPRLGSFAAYDY
ncbi:hypothetical protein BJX68DRAFT_237605 [Aspergillus pseudodeflectus]|uniref:Uncharacterized protein n=1 Tax=Aspergillus pseudodeflectus TaxID=176178 RepID=A0ABR4KD87_9EURO